ncbi:MAG TPA: hypothetical protein VKA18_13430 [Alphaproteobacteria bacterium]|nr:hypothetical protein [Alphaproteobacteria bacterium]
MERIGLYGKRSPESYDAIHIFWQQLYLFYNADIQIGFIISKVTYKVSLEHVKFDGILFTIMGFLLLDTKPKCIP